MGAKVGRQAAMMEVQGSMAPQMIQLTTVCEKSLLRDWYSPWNLTM